MDYNGKRLMITFDGKRLTATLPHHPAVRGKAHPMPPELIAKVDEIAAQLFEVERGKDLLRCVQTPVAGASTMLEYTLRDEPAGRLL